ncbi:TPA: hypothetical protein ACF2DS_000776 [Clostridium perfringens]
MDARKLGLKTIKKAILNDCYEVTGVLGSGEVTIALITDVDIRVR